MINTVIFSIFILDLAPNFNLNEQFSAFVPNWSKKLTSGLKQKN